MTCEGIGCLALFRGCLGLVTARGCLSCSGHLGFGVGESWALSSLSPPPGACCSMKCLQKSVREPLSPGNGGK